MKGFSLIILIHLSTVLIAQEYPTILSMEERANKIDELLKDRFRTVLPAIMERENIDMWIIIAREYNEDPVIKTMLPATWLNARRRTILVIYDSGKQSDLETYAIARYNVGEIFQKAWDKENQPDQWEALVQLIVQKNPQKIGLNISSTFALADGLSTSEYEAFKSKLPENLHPKIVSAEKIAVGWLETRTSAEMEVYRDLCRIAHNIIAEGFSEKIITPEKTSTDDVVWWLRDRIKELRLDTWFHPSVSVQRADKESFDHQRSFSEPPSENIIQYGDLLHVDFGITYLRLNTDTQQHAYVLKPGEEDAPEYLMDALKKANRVQDIFIENFQEGKTGNQVLAESIQQAKKEDLNPTIYTHPLGFHGHAAGPTIGLWDQQGGVPGRGDYLFRETFSDDVMCNPAKVPINFHFC